MVRLDRSALLLAALLLTGCSGSPAPQKEEPKKDEARKEEFKPPTYSEEEKKQLQALVAAELAKHQPAGPASAAPFDPPPADQFNALLVQALLRRADGKHDQALADLEEAQRLARTDENKQLVQREIEREKALLAQQAATERTVNDIQAILNQGKADEAAKLATEALQQYGGTDTADRLVRLKQQADALVSVRTTDPGALRTRCRAEGDAALKEGNLRAAAVAYENALQGGEDPGLRKQLDELRGRLTRYDDSRRRAAELRKDSGGLEDALTAYQEAARAWDTTQVRQEIDECTQALQNRRDRLSVAEFEVLGEVGLPFAGRRFAEELLPAFKQRYDLVEREQIGKLLDELKLQASDLASNDAGRQQLGQLARLRYLVLGSVFVDRCVTVNARLVDVRTGLIVQTGKATAPTAEGLLPLLPEVARQLMMSEEQKLVYEQELANRNAKSLDLVAANEPLPPAPPVAAPEAVPAIVPVMAAPALGTIAVNDVAFSPPPAPGQRAQLVIALEKEDPLRQRSLRLAVELGDNLFRRGRYREAYAKFDLALSLSPGQREVELRLERCRPCLPPEPPVTVVAPRPRLAVLEFVAEGVGRDLGAWTAEGLAPYFSNSYDVVDKGEVYWYMGRLGLSLADVYRDPFARRWLGRALGVRFFVLGSVAARGGLETTSHLVDAECGYEAGSGRVVAADPGQLRCALPELARLTLMSPEERARYLQPQDECRRLLLQARQCQERREFTAAVTICEKAHKLCPVSVEIVVVLERNKDAARRADWEVERRAAEDQQRRAQALEAQRRQELQRQAEQARIQAEQQARVQAEAARQQQAVERQRAYERLCAQAEAAFEGKNFALAAQLYESAAALIPNEVCFRRLAESRARFEEQRRAAAPVAVVVGARPVRPEEVARARAEIQRGESQVEAEKRSAARAQEARDQAEYTRLIDAARVQTAQGKHAEAVVSLQAARRLRRTDEVESLLNGEQAAQARASEQAKNAPAAADLEKRLAEEKQRRIQAEAEAKRKEKLYNDTLAQAQQARAAGQYDAAISKCQAAIALYRTDAALTLLADLQQAKARAEAQQKEQQAAATRKARVAQLIQNGQQAQQAGQLDAAITQLTEAKKLDPTNVDVLTALSKAEVARDHARAAARAQETAKGPPPSPPATQPRPAPTPVTPPSAPPSKPNPTPATQPARPSPTPPAATPPAPKPSPIPAAPPPAPPKTNPTPSAPPTTAPARPAPMPSAPTTPPAKPAPPPPPPPPPNPSPEYTKQMQVGAALAKQQKYTDAIKAFQEALKLQPGDKPATDALHRAEFDLHIMDGNKAMAAKKYAEAVKEFEAALKAEPGNAEATALLKKAKEGKP